MRFSLGRGMLAAFFLASPVALGAEPAGAPVRFDVTGLESAAGRVRCGLFLDNDWAEEGKQVAGVDALIEDGKATCAFDNVAPGRYAVVAYHDANDNHRLDKNFLGIPREAYCFSEDAPGGLGVPEFRKASFVVGAEPVRSRCKL